MVSVGTGDALPRAPHHPAAVHHCVAHIDAITKAHRKRGRVDVGYSPESMITLPGEYLARVISPPIDRQKKTRVILSTLGGVKYHAGPHVLLAEGIIPASAVLSTSL